VGTLAALSLSPAQVQAQARPQPPKPAAAPKPPERPALPAKAPSSAAPASPEARAQSAAAAAAFGRAFAAPGLSAGVAADSAGGGVKADGGGSGPQPTGARLPRSAKRKPGEGSLRQPTPGPRVGAQPAEKPQQDHPPIKPPGPPDLDAIERQFLKAEALQERATRVRLPGGMAQLQGALQEKVKLFSEAMQLYQRVASAGDPEFAVAALVRSGDLFMDLAYTLGGLQAPKELGPGGGPMFTQQMRQVEKQIATVAAKQYRQAVSEGTKAGLQTEWTQAARERLGLLPGAK